MGGVIDQCESFAAHLGLPETMIETGPYEDELTDELKKREYRPLYTLPIHRIPVDELDLEPLPANFGSRFVCHDRGVAEFAALQDRAYAESYAYHSGCAGSFFSHPTSLVGADVSACLVSDEYQNPVRGGQIIRAGGRVWGMSGAADPRVRGQHLGDEVWRRLLGAAQISHGAFEVWHATMPIAMPIATRHALEEVARWTRWAR